jgi:serine/threonine protein kinase
LSTSTSRRLGKYRLVATLGQGGMSDVYLSMVDGPTGTGFAKLVAVKRLRPDLVEDPDFVTMLIDEARICSRLNHPNVVQTLEVGADRDEYFLAMEFLQGQPFHRIKRRAERYGVEMPTTYTYLVLLDALAGLHHAHELADYDGTPLSVVHRDITPQNLFVTYDGQIKIVDFGIAKAAGCAAQTRQGLVKGKVRYMSPEQACGRAVDRRTDLFAVGILLWEAATGERFWGDRDELSIAHAVVNGEYEPSPRAINPDVSAAIDAVCRKALAFDLEDRYLTAADFRAELEAAAGDGVVKARRELGPMVARLFDKERQTLKSVIEQAAHASRASLQRSALERPSLMPSQGLMPSLTLDSISASAGGVVLDQGSLPPQISDSLLSDSLPLPVRSDEHEPRRTSRTATAFAMGVVAAAAILVVTSATTSFLASEGAPSRRSPREEVRTPNVLVTSEITQLAHRSANVGARWTAAPVGAAAAAARPSTSEPTAPSAAPPQVEDAKPPSVGFPSLKRHPHSLDPW